MLTGLTSMCPRCCFFLWSFPEHCFNYILTISICPRHCFISSLATCLFLLYRFPLSKAGKNLTRDLHLHSGEAVILTKCTLSHTWCLSFFLHKHNFWLNFYPHKSATKQILRQNSVNCNKTDFAPKKNVSCDKLMLLRSCGEICHVEKCFHMTDFSTWTN